MTRSKILNQREVRRIQRYFTCQNRWRICQTIGTIFYHSKLPDEQVELLLQYFTQADFVAEFLPTLTQK